MGLGETRADFKILEKQREGRPFIYFDNAATSLTPNQVVEAMNSYYFEFNANIHRGVHSLSEKASEEYEGAHEKIAKFVGAKKEEFVFTRNTTESVNLVMYSLLCSDFFSEGDEILLTAMEHHSNLVPWQFAAKKSGASLKFIELNEDFTLDMDDFREKLSDKTRLVSVAHASNTVGTINPVKEIASEAKKAGALFFVDAAQSVPHMPVSFHDIGADFLAFSGHKMLGPTGTGGLCVKKGLMDSLNPFIYGGSMIGEVSREKSSWAGLPWRFEAGTPDIAGCIGLGKAVEYLKKTGMENIRAHAKKLLGLAAEELKGMEKLKVFNSLNPEIQGPVILFNSETLGAHELALALDEAANIEVRSGMHCAEPLISRLDEKGVVRASFYFYNTEEEVKLFAEELKKILAALG